MKKINVGVAGCLGRMGQELVKEIIKNKRLNFSGGFETPKHKNINKKISDLLFVKTSHKVSSDPKLIFSKSDIVIDFTVPKAILKNLTLATAYNTNLIIGTTGLNKKILKSIKMYSKKIAILQSSNMSLAVNLVFNIAQQAASKLSDVDYDIEISETHHKHKLDAPSGTALKIGNCVAKGRKANFERAKVLDRTNSILKRKIGQIGFAVSRGGEIAGEHTLSFIGENDRIDLSHKANNRSIFVKGAIEASIFIYKKKKGLYSMEDVVGS